MELLKKLSITHIVNVTDDCENRFEKDTKIKYLRISVSDSWGQSLPEHFAKAFAFIDEAKQCVLNGEGRRGGEGCNGLSSRLSSNVSHQSRKKQGRGPRPYPLRRRHLALAHGDHCLCHPGEIVHAGRGLCLRQGWTERLRWTHACQLYPTLPHLTTQPPRPSLQSKRPVISPNLDFMGELQVYEEQVRGVTSHLFQPKGESSTPKSPSTPTSQVLVN